MRHIVSLSGGTASAVAADRVMKRYGKANTTLWFADTSWEDEDLYRFLGDLEVYWGMEIVRYRDGRNPLEVAEQASIIPNQRRAPCTLALKIVPFREWVALIQEPVTLHLGLDWTEQHRLTRPKAEYEANPNVTVDCPLMWNPIALPPHRLETESWGIETPRLYKMGFSHNNCGGRCVKQGIRDWIRLKQMMPERFWEVAKWEQRQRSKGGARANYAIARDQSNNQVRPRTLMEIAEMCESQDTIERLQLSLWSQDEDRIGCYCSY